MMSKDTILKASTKKSDSAKAIDPNAVLAINDRANNC